MRYRLSPILKIDLEDIAEWIAREDPRRAVRIIRRLRAEFRKIARQPMNYRL